MKLFLENISLNLFSLACVGFAGYLAFHDKQGWGYFLFVAALCARIVKY